MKREGAIAQNAPILPEGSDVTAALHQAARDNDRHRVRLCLAMGADATSYENGYTAIGSAAISACPHVIEEFRSFYFQSRRADELVNLLKQPQGFRTFFGIKFLPKFKNFNEIIEFSGVYPEGSINRLSFESLLAEAQSEFSGR